MKGVAYLLNVVSNDDTSLTTVKVKSENIEVGSEEGSKNSRVLALSSCLREVYRGHVSICVVYDVATAPQLNLVKVHIPCSGDIRTSSLDDGATVGSLSEDTGKNCNS